MLRLEFRLLALLSRPSCYRSSAVCSSLAQQALQTQHPKCDWEFAVATEAAPSRSLASFIQGLRSCASFSTAPTAAARQKQGILLVSACPALEPSNSGIGCRWSSSLAAFHGWVKERKGTAGGGNNGSEAKQKQEGVFFETADICGDGVDKQRGWAGGRGKQGGDGLRGTFRGPGGAGGSPFSNIRDKSFADLQQLLQQYGGSIKRGDLLAMFSRLKSVPEADAKQKVALLQHLLQLLEPQLQQCQPRGLGEVMLTCSKLGYGETQLYSSCLEVVVSKLQQADAQVLANIVYAIATAPTDMTRRQCWPVVKQQLLPAFTEAVADGQAAPQGISNVLWGVATMGQQLPAEQLQLLLIGFVRVVGEAAPQGIANVILAAAKMQQQVPAGQLQKLVEALADKLHSADPQAITNTMWGVARLRPQPFFPSPLLKPKAKQAILRLLPAMVPQGLANMAWACGMLGYQDEQLLLPLFNRGSKIMFAEGGSSSTEVGATCHALANMCWAAAVLDMQQLIRHVEQFAAAVSSKWEEAASEGKFQLYQVHMWLLDQQGNSRGLSACLSAQQLQECKEQWQKDIAECAASARTFPTHRAVFVAAQCLSGLGQPAQLEAVTADGLHTIDVVVVTKGNVRVAIEFDGPYHFRQPDLQPTGPTQCRNRSLAARGYVVVSVPYWEWDPLPNSQHVAYLQSKVQRALAGGQQRADVPAPLAAAAASINTMSAESGTGSSSLGAGSKRNRGSGGEKKKRSDACSSSSSRGSSSSSVSRGSSSSRKKQ